MTRFGKSQINHDTLLSRNPSRSVVEKSISKLKASKDKIKSLTTKDIPYVGVAESAAIADLFNEPGSVNQQTLEAKIRDSDECLNSLAFTKCVDKFYKQIQTSLNQKTNKAILEKFYLDERVPIMLSVGITKILSDIIEALKKTSESAISQDGVNKGKRVHFINVEDLFAHVDNKFGSVINLKQQRITDQNNNLKIYDILKDIDGIDYADSLAKQHVQRLLNGLTKVDEKHVGDTFSVTITDPHTALSLADCVNYFLKACKRVEFVTNISAIDNTHAKYAVGAIFGVIATHIMSYAFYSAIDEVLRSLDQANKKFGATNPLDGKMFHRAMLYPSIVAALDLYGLSESEFDHVIAKEITTVKAVREVFKLAITNYDYEATAIAAKTFRHAAPKVPSFLRSPEEILEAQMKLDKMLVTAPNAGVATAPGPVGPYTGMTSWTAGSDIYKQKALAAKERAENIYGTWSFGRRRKSKRSSFGKRRKSRRASFGKRRGSKKRSMKFGEDGTKVEVLFGRRRKSRRAAAFGKRRSSKRRSMKFGNDLGDQIANQFGRRRKSRRAAAFGKRRSSKRRSMKFGEDGTKVEVLFGKRRGSKRRSMKFGNDMGDMVAGISFGKRRGSKRRASFGKRRGSKRRASFGKKRGSKRRSSFGKRRGSKRRN